MKLETFLVLQHRKDILEKNLISVTGGSDISINELWNKIYFKVEEYLAAECSESEIKEMVKRLVSDYELRTDVLKAKTKKIMVSMGFNFDEEENIQFFCPRCEKNDKLRDMGEPILLCDRCNFGFTKKEAKYGN